MKSYYITIINAIVLILLAFWGFLESNFTAYTALIPLIVGVLLLLLSKGIKLEKKLESHFVVLLTLLLFIALFKPLSAAFHRSDCIAITRVGIMLITTFIALIFYIRSFIQARKKQ